MRRLSLGALLALLLAAGAAGAAVDPFYRARMEAGVRAFDQGDWEQADHQLRIACFGHLEEPLALVGGLMRLAVVRATLDDEDGFRKIFSRLIELEERFSAYSAARVPGELRQRFESLAALLVPEQSLRAAHGFQTIADRAVAQRLDAMPPDARRAELEKLIEAEPYREEWLLEMARLEMEARRPELALDWLDRLPAEAAGSASAVCLQQQAASEGKSCSRIDLGRPICAGLPDSVFEFRLHCLVEAERWIEASALVAELPATTRARRRVRRLVRKIDKNLGAAAAGTGAGEAVGEAVPAEPAPPPAGEPAAEATRTEVAAELSTPVAEPQPRAQATPPQPALDRRELEALRLRLAAAASREEIVELTAEAEALATRHPGSRQAQLLAAELAYLQSDWPLTIHYFGRAGELRPSEAHLVFYRAVALYETGERVAAADLLRPVAPRLEGGSFVRAWVDRILGSGASGDD